MGTLSRWHFDRRYGQEFTADDVKNAIPIAIEELKYESYYAPFINRYPYMLDDGMPKMARQNLKDNQTGMCADENNVYIDTELTAMCINMAIAKHEEKTSSSYGCNLIDNLKNMIAHEYTHILCQHKRIINSMGKLTKLERDCLIVTAEIEANRGHMVKKDVALYDVSVTEDDYPQVIPCRYFPEIYAELLRTAKDNLKKIQQLAQMAGDMADAGNQQGKGSGKGKGKKQGKEQESGQNQGQVSGQEGDDNSKSNEKSSTVGTELTNEKGSEGDTEYKEINLTEDDIAKAIEKMKNAQAQVYEEDQAAGDAYGIGLEGAVTGYNPERTPQQQLETVYRKWQKVNIKKELKKLKGLIRGEISKNKEKTYARPSRRATSSTGLIKKGVKYEKSYSPKVLIALDSSGSMNGTTMKQVACAIENIFKDLGKPKTGSYICVHESYVSNVEPMRKWKKVVETYRPCGGNNFENVVKKANELKVDVVLNVGDGQDCCCRNMEAFNPCEQFTAAKRKWFDVLVSDKCQHSSYVSEKAYDEAKGFERNEIFLGDNIAEALK